MISYLSDINKVMGILFLYLAPYRILVLYVLYECEDGCLDFIIMKTVFVECAVIL